LNQQLRRKLDHITDILWAGGVTNPVTYIEQISYLIFLKLLDEEENDRELRIRLSGGTASTHGNATLLYPAQAERYRWSKWRFKSGQELRDYIRDEVFPYMASLAKDEPEVAEYFRDAVLEIVDPNVLKQVIDELDGFEFRKLGPDVKGDIFEYLLVHLGSSSLNGQFRTPRQIRAFMVEMVDPDIGDSMFDPACGTAGFLIDAVDYLLAKYSDHITEYPIYGEDWLEKKGQTHRRDQGANAQAANLPQGRRREDSRLEPARGLGVRHRRLAPDGAHQHDEPGAARHPPCQAEARQFAVRHGRAFRGRFAPPLQGHPGQPALRRPVAQGFDPRGSADQFQEKRTAVPLLDDAAPRARRTLCRGGAGRAVVRLDRRPRRTCARNW
jgi:hypothetical protein